MKNSSTIASPSPLAASSRDSSAKATNSYNQLLGYHDDSDSMSVYSGAATESPDAEEQKDILYEEKKDIGNKIHGEDESIEGLPVKSLDPVLISASSSICSITEQKPEKNENDENPKPVSMSCGKFSKKTMNGSKTGASTVSSGASRKSSPGVVLKHSLEQSKQSDVKPKKSESRSINDLNSKDFSGKIAEETLEENKTSKKGNRTEISRDYGSGGGENAYENSFESSSIEAERAGEKSTDLVIGKKENASETVTDEDHTKKAEPALISSCNPLPVTIEENETESEVEVSYGDTSTTMGESVREAIASSSGFDARTQHIANTKDPGSGSSKENIEISASSIVATDIGSLASAGRDSVKLLLPIPDKLELKDEMKNSTSNISITDTASLTDQSGESMHKDTPVVYHPKAKPDFFQKLFNCNSNPSTTVEDDAVIYPIDDVMNNEVTVSEKPYESNEEDSMRSNKANTLDEMKPKINSFASTSSKSFQMMNDEEIEHTISLGPGIHLFNATSADGDGIEIYKVMVPEKREVAKETVEEIEAVDSNIKSESTKKRGIKSILRLKEKKSSVFKPFQRGKQPVCQ